MGKSVQNRSRGRSRSPPPRGAPYGRPSRFGSSSSRSPPGRGGSRFDGPRPSRFDSPPSRLDGPMPPSRFDGPPPSSRFDGPPPPSRFDGPLPPSRFDGPPSRFDGPPKSRFDGPPSRFDGPPPPFDHPGPGLDVPPPPPLPEGPGNDIEIIVVNREQWRYAEMIERRLREETPVKYIDLLFLHSPQHISMTLNDLFERYTLYAIVVNQINEEHRSCTLHVLHNQEEHRNIPIDEAIPLIARDFAMYMNNSARGQGTPSEGYREPYGASTRPPGIPNYSSVTTPSTAPPLFPSASRPAQVTESTPNGSNPPNPIPPPTSITSSGSSGANSEKRLPDDIAYLLRTTLSEGGVQFLSLQQIDSVIDYFKRERDRLTSSAPRHITSSSMVSDHTGRSNYQSTDNSGYASKPANSSSVPTDPNALLENPQVKAALNSLLQIGAISSAPTNQTVASSYVNSLAKNPNDSGTSYSTNNASLTPSYLSTSSSIQPNTSAPHQYSGSSSSSSSYQQQQPSVQSGTNTSNQTRRHPLMGTEISEPSATSSYSSYGMRNNSNNQTNRGYSTSSRY